MPEQGPNGEQMYLPHEAYNLIGRKVYKDEWRSAFSGKGPLPDLEVAKRILERGGRDAELLQFLGDDSDQNYAIVQSWRFRESDVFERLLDALVWGKTEALAVKDDKTWQPISPKSWAAQPELKEQLRDELLTVLRDLLPSAGRLLIDKPLLDKWVLKIRKPVDVAPVVKQQPQKIGRPGADWNAIREELHRLELAEEIPQASHGWRQRLCQRLRDWYADNFPEKETAGGVPDVKTIKRRLKTDIDAIERRRKGDKDR